MRNYLYLNKKKWFNWFQQSLLLIFVNIHLHEWYRYKLFSLVVIRYEKFLCFNFCDIYRPVSDEFRLNPHEDCFDDFRQNQFLTFLYPENRSIQILWTFLQVDLANVHLNDSVCSDVKDGISIVQIREKISMNIWNNIIPKICNKTLPNERIFN